MTKNLKKKIIKKPLRGGQVSVLPTPAEVHVYVNLLVSGTTITIKNITNPLITSVPTGIPGTLILNIDPTLITLKDYTIFGYKETSNAWTEIPRANIDMGGNSVSLYGTMENMKVPVRKGRGATQQASREIAVPTSAIGNILQFNNISDSVFDFKAAVSQTNGANVYVQLVFLKAGAALKSDATQWDPTSIPGLNLWLDATQPGNNTMVPNTLFPVESWIDKSGQKNHAKSSTAAPTYTTGNEKPALYFAGAGTMTGSLKITDQKYTVFTVTSPQITTGVTPTNIVTLGSTNPVNIQYTPSSTTEYTIVTVPTTSINNAIQISPTNVSMWNLQGIRGMAFDPVKNVMYLVDTLQGRVFSLNLTTNEISVLAGTILSGRNDNDTSNLGYDGRFFFSGWSGSILFCSFDPDSGFLYISERGNNQGATTCRTINTLTGEMATLKDGNTGNNRGFSNPMGNTIITLYGTKYFVINSAVPGGQMGLIRFALNPSVPFMTTTSYDYFPYMDGSYNWLPGGSTDGTYHTARPGNPNYGNAMVSDIYGNIYFVDGNLIRMIAAEDPTKVVGTYQGSISDTTLTLTSAVAIPVGSPITGTGILPGTFIVPRIATVTYALTPSTTYTINISQTVAQTAINVGRTHVLITIAGDTSTSFIGKTGEAGNRYGPPSTNARLTNPNFIAPVVNPGGWLTFISAGDASKGILGRTYLPGEANQFRPEWSWVVGNLPRSTTTAETRLPTFVEPRCTITYGSGWGITVDAGNNCIFYNLIQTGWGGPVYLMAGGGEATTTAVPQTGIAGYRDGPCAIGTDHYLNAVKTNVVLFNSPSTIVIHRLPDRYDESGPYYLTDTGNHSIRRRDGNILGGAIFGTIWHTIAGAPPPTATAGFADGDGPNARFRNPYGIVFSAASNLTQGGIDQYLLVSDSGNNCIRKITPKQTGNPNPAGDFRPTLLPYRTAKFIGSVSQTTLTVNVMIPGSLPLEVGMLIDVPSGGSIVNQLTGTAVFVGSITGTTLTVTAVTSGTIILNTRINTTAGGTITAQTAGTPPGGPGTYTISISQTVASPGITIIASGGVGTYTVSNSQDPATNTQPTFEFTAAVSGGTLTLNSTTTTVPLPNLPTSSAGLYLKSTGAKFAVITGKTSNTVYQLYNWENRTYPAGTAFFAASRECSASFQWPNIETTWAVTTFAGPRPTDGITAGEAGVATGPPQRGSLIRFNNPTAIIGGGVTLYVADTGNNAIRRIDMSINFIGSISGTTLNVTTNPTPVGAVIRNGMFISGTGVAAGTQIVSFNSSGGYEGYWGNYTVNISQTVAANTTFTTEMMATTLPIPGLNGPKGLLINNADLFIADTGNHVIKKATLANVNKGIPAAAGAGGNPGSADGIGDAASFNGPLALSIDKTGTLYILDGDATNKHKLRIMTPSTFPPVIRNDLTGPIYTDTTWTVRTNDLYENGVIRPDTAPLNSFVTSTDSAGNIYFVDGTTVKKIVKRRDVTLGTNYTSSSSTTKTITTITKLPINGVDPVYAPIITSTSASSTNMCQLINGTNVYTPTTFTGTISLIDNTFMLCDAGRYFDGVVWNNTPTPTRLPGNVKTYAYNGTRWVVGGNGTTSLAYSDNGVSWTISTTGNAIFSSCDQIRWGKDKFVAVGVPLTGKQPVAYSADGITWTEAPGTRTLLASWGRAVGYNGTDKWLVSGYNVTTFFRLIQSTDGISWTNAVTTTALAQVELLNFMNGRWFWCGSRGGGGQTTPDPNTISYSTDGITWTPASTAASEMRDSQYACGVYAIGSNATMMIAGGYGTNSLVYSTDGGTTWQKYTNLRATFDGTNWNNMGSSLGYVRNICWDNDNKIWHILSDPSWYFQSRDGFSWNNISINSFTTLPTQAGPQYFVMPRSTFPSSNTAAPITVLNVSAVTSGTLSVGMSINTLKGGKISALLTGTGGIGMYLLDTPQRIGLPTLIQGIPATASTPTCDPAAPANTQLTTYSVAPANFRGYVHEILVYTRTLEEPQRQLVEGYLASKWGISLTRNHPYTLKGPTLTGDTAPSAITSVTIANVSSKSITFAWEGGNYATAYKYYVYIGTYSATTTLAVEPSTDNGLQSNSVLFKWPSIARGCPFKLRIVATNPRGSVSSAEFPFSLPAPTGTIFTIAGNGIRSPQWNAISTFPINNNNSAGYSTYLTTAKFMACITASTLTVRAMVPPANPFASGTVKAGMVLQIPDGSTIIPPMSGSTAYYGTMANYGGVGNYNLNNPMYMTLPQQITATMICDSAVVPGPVQTYYSNCHLSVPYSICASQDGNILYVYDSQNNRIVKITKIVRPYGTFWEILPWMGGGASLTGAGTAALTDGGANTLVVPTATNFPATGGPADTYTPITISAAGTARFSGFASAWPNYTSSCDMCRSLDGKRIYVLNRDGSNNTAFRLINVEAGTVTTFRTTAGTGAAPALNQSEPFSSSRWNNPERWALSPDGTILYVLDASNCLRTISPIDLVTYLPTDAATVTTIINNTQFTGVKALTVSKSGLVYAVNSDGRLVRYSPADKSVVTLQLPITDVRGIAISPDENTLYISDRTNNRLLYMPNVKSFNNVVLLNLCGTNQEISGGDNGGLMTNNNGYINAVKDGHPSLAQIYNLDLNALTISDDGKYLYVCCTEASLVRIVTLTQQDVLPMFSHLVPGVTFSP